MFLAPLRSLFVLREYVTSTTGANILLIFSLFSENLDYITNAIRSELCNPLVEKERARCFALIMFLLPCGYSWTVSPGAVGWSVVGDCGIFWSYSLAFWHFARGYKIWAHSQTQNKAQWLAACGHVSTISQSLRFFILRLYSSFITPRPGLEHKHLKIHVIDLF